MGIFDSLIIENETDRVFTAYATVEIVDRQNQFVPLEAFKKAFYKYLIRGATLHISDNNAHSPKVVGRILNGEEETFEGYKAFKITCTIYPHDDQIPDYDDAWNGIKSGKFKGVSIGGGLLKDVTLTMKDGVECEVINNVPLMEICVVERPANPLSLISGMSLAKSDLSKPGNVDEAKWNKAKEAARKEYGDIADDKFYAIVQTIYQKMEKGDNIDVVSFDVPLITRLFEYFTENKVPDERLHFMLERMIEESKKGSLTMEQYESIIDTKLNNLEKAEVKPMVEEKKKVEEPEAEKPEAPVKEEPKVEEPKEKQPEPAQEQKTPSEAVKDSQSFDSLHEKMDKLMKSHEELHKCMGELHKMLAKGFKTEEPGEEVKEPVKEENETVADEAAESPAEEKKEAVEGKEEPIKEEMKKAEDKTENKAAEILKVEKETTPMAKSIVVAVTPSILAVESSPNKSLWEVEVERRFKK